MYDAELYHHGIKGQKWGKRNGPPYPLDANDHSASEKKAGWRRSLKKNKSFKLTDRQKRMLKYGAIAAGVALAAYGAYKLGTKADFTSSLASIGGATNKISKETLSENVRKFIKDADVDNRVRLVNPEYDPSDIFHLSDKMNCGNCAVAFEANMRGEQLSARPNSAGMFMEHLLSGFEGLTEDNIIRDVDINRNTKSGEPIRKLVEETITSKFPNYSRGAIAFPMNHGNHFFNWINVNGEVLFIDSQRKTYRVKNLFRMYNPNPARHKNRLGLNGIEIVRLDNAKLSKIGIDELTVTKENSQFDWRVANQPFDATKIRGANFVMDLFDENDEDDAGILDTISTLRDYYG